MKLLVANRSEIACRIFQACRETGLRTVAVVAPGDEDARHVTYADEVHKVSSYLDISAILKAVSDSGAKFVHPGYGFLSERPAFASAIEESGVAFLGPTAATMQRMGDKIAAKGVAEKIGVPTLPWATLKAGGNLKEAAKKVGFPLLLKAAAGGGGKGMRKVGKIEEIEAAAESAMAEAKSAFGDGTLFLEKLVTNPRHIEVQVFGDGHGDGIHLFERECSLQRRHQKIWEEAPAPHLSEKTKQGLYESAIKLLKEVQYRSAGTIEFLVDSDENYFFLEMNTRLQVEHPVTEFITGLDLVHAQIRLAMNSKSKIKDLFPTQTTVRGHSIEVRLYAEDPAQGFIPTPGKIEKLKWPSGPGIRVDSGIEEGQNLGISFDSMLAKLIVAAPSREMALARLRYALEETVILGLGTNHAYLKKIAEHPAVQAGKVTTDFLDREMGSWKPELSTEALEAIALQGASTGSISFSNPNDQIQFPSPWNGFGANP
jgi:acetyl/propionyl-CoA carboxylase alpha subunit